METGRFGLIPNNTNTIDISPAVRLSKEDQNLIRCRDFRICDVASKADIPTLMVVLIVVLVTVFVVDDRHKTTQSLYAQLMLLRPKIIGIFSRSLIDQQSSVILLLYVIYRVRKRRRKITFPSLSEPRRKPKYYTGIFEDVNMSTLSYINLELPEIAVDDRLSVISLDNDDFLHSIEDIDYQNYLSDLHSYNSGQTKI